MANRPNNKKRFDNKKKGRNKGSEDKFEPRDRSNNRRDYDSTAVGHNDASWYASSPDLLRDAGSFSFNNPLGNRIDLSDIGLKFNDDYSIPGVCTIYTSPSIGKSVDNSSPINIAARNIYSYVRHANSGHSNYDSPDLMMYLLAMDSLYSFFAYMVRAYGVIRTYSQANRYLPRGVVQGMGLDFDDLQSNLANFRYYINLCSEKIGSLCAPKSMSYFTRHMWMYSHVYKDGENDKASLYQFSPMMFYKFVPTEETTGGILVPHMVFSPSKLVKFAELKTAMDHMIAAVIQDEDMNIMSGDILKAFTAEGVFKLASIAEDYIVEPVFNLEVLNQIQNVTLLGALDDVNTYKITQSAQGAILFNPQFAGKIKGDILQTKRILNSYSTAPTPDEVMVSTRMMAIAEKPVEGTYYLDSLGSEFALQARLLRFSKQPGVGWAVTPNSYATVVEYANLWTDDHGQYMVPWICQLETFDMHPYALIAAEEADPNVPYSITGIVGDLDNYTLINYYDLRKLHETALLSEFNVPQMGAFAQKN